MSKSIDSCGAENATPPTLVDSWKADLVAGFLVFLIALPLCLGIAKASGFPPIAGVFTAVFGGLITGLFSNSELTIKGPAAGMIAIVAGAMYEFGYQPIGGGVDPIFGTGMDANMTAYRYVLAVGVVAGIIQIALGLLRAGILTEFFPMAPVHGLLASIGLIIISKQSYLLFGFDGSRVAKAPWDAFLQIFSEVVGQADPKATIIGLSSLAILFAYPWVKKSFRFLGPIPAQLVVLLLAIPLGQAFQLPKALLVRLPDRVTDAVVTPDFGRILDPVSLKWILMFCMVGSLESLLSAKAIDILDPWKRKTNMNRDLLGVGVANAAVAVVGGLPMISEILRSSANIANGARTRLSDAFHALFLLSSILLLAAVVKMIPLAALGAMLVYAGYRLASPKEFVHMWHLGLEQFVIFVLTIACIWPHGELLLVFVGIAAELLINVVNGASLGSLFKPRYEAQLGPMGTTLQLNGALTFTNWIPLKRRLDGLAEQPQVTLDVSESRLLDHTVMDKLLQTQREFRLRGCMLELIGLDQHRAFGHDPASGRKKLSMA